MVSGVPLVEKAMSDFNAGFLIWRIEPALGHGHTDVSVQVH